MKFFFILIVSSLAFSCSGELITVYKDSKLGSKDFTNKNIIICPTTGEWFFVGTDTSFFASPEAKLYTQAFIQKFRELRPCVNIIDHSRLSYIAPNLERSMNSRKYCFSNMSKEDSTFFLNLSNTFNADYLIFFESVEFFSSKSNIYQVGVANKESKLIFQLWDLRLSKMVYRAQSSGSGSSIQYLFDDHSSTSALENSFVEYIESLPKCISGIN